MFQGKFFASAFKKEIPSGSINGSNTSFSLTYTPANSDSLLVFIDGILQNLTSDYSLSSNIITLVVAPAIGQSIYCFYLEK